MTCATYEYERMYITHLGEVPRFLYKSVLTADESKSTHDHYLYNCCDGRYYLNLKSNDIQNPKIKNIDLKVLSKNFHDLAKALPTKKHLNFDTMEHRILSEFINFIENLYPENSTHEISVINNRLILLKNLFSLSEICESNEDVNIAFVRLTEDLQSDIDKYHHSILLASIHIRELLKKSSELFVEFDEKIVKYLNNDRNMNRAFLDEKELFNIQLKKLASNAEDLIFIEELIESESAAILNTEQYHQRVCKIFERILEDTIAAHAYLNSSDFCIRLVKNIDKPFMNYSFTFDYFKEHNRIRDDEFLAFKDQLDELLLKAIPACVYNARDILLNKNADIDHVNTENKSEDNNISDSSEDIEEKSQMKNKPIKHQNVQNLILNGFTEKQKSKALSQKQQRTYYNFTESKYFSHLAQGVFQRIDDEIKHLRDSKKQDNITALRELKNEMVNVIIEYLVSKSSEENENDKFSDSPYHKLNKKLQKLVKSKIEDTPELDTPDNYLIHVLRAIALVLLSAVLLFTPLLSEKYRDFTFKTSPAYELSQASRDLEGIRSYR